MKESVMLRLSLVSSVIGVIILFIIYLAFEPELSSPSSIKDKKQQDFVKVRGKVSGIRQLEKLRVISITEEIGANAIDFDIGKNPAYAEGDFVELFGRISDYNGENEIIIEKIRKIS